MSKITERDVIAFLEEKIAAIQEELLKTQATLETLKKTPGIVIPESRLPLLKIRPSSARLIPIKNKRERMPKLRV